MKINVTFQLLFYTCLMTIASHGQTDKGSFLLGGSIGFTHNSTTTYGTSGASIDSKSFMIDVQPSVSYFIIDRLAVGLTTPYSYSKIKSKSYQTELTATTKTYSVGPLVRYYFPLGSEWAIFPEVSYNYGWAWNDGLTDKSRTFQGGVGLVYFLNQSVGVEGKAFYQNQHTTYDENSNAYRATSSDEPDFNFSVGVQIYFARKANP
ncbi:MAG TPA: outer membrane beta-barrel protein [Chryseolinea sp.]